jgi:hypothetical protein
MHAEPAEEPKALALPPAAPEPPTPGEWAIGILFVLAAVALVGLIAWAIAGLPA